jgi:2'-5' RNA ligase
VAGDDRVRLFCALRLPDDVLAALEGWQAELRGDVRRLDRSKLHVTLAFLGHRPRTELGAVVDVLRDAAASAASIVFEPLRYRETRSVGMLVLDDIGGHATALADDLQDRLERLRVYRREARAWLPHVTVVRFRERPRLRPELPSVGRFAPSDAAAFLSRLTPGGAEYDVLESVPLGG